jgi:glycosyltransferase involved in cell wall biosynthesis
MDITAVIIAKNEERNIRDCIKALGFCEEIIVIDDYSQDKTPEIARKMGAKVFQRALNGDFAAQRNYALGKVKSKWAFFVDADERVKPALRNELAQFIDNPRQKYNGFMMTRKDVLWGKEMRHGEFGRIHLVRVGKVGAGEWMRKVHETWRIEGNLRLLKSPLLHYPHPTLRQFISDVNWQSSIHAGENLAEKKRSNILKIVFYPLGKFVVNWKLKLGLLDGTEGFVAAMIMSFHSFLSWAKQWVKQQKI